MRVQREKNSTTQRVCQEREQILLAAEFSKNEYVNVANEKSLFFWKAHVSRAQHTRTHTSTGRERVLQRHFTVCARARARVRLSCLCVFVFFSLCFRWPTPSLPYTDKIWSTCNVRYDKLVV